jgi:Fe2+ transport system protein B
MRERTRETSLEEKEKKISASNAQPFKNYMFYTSLMFYFDCVALMIVFSSLSGVKWDKKYWKKSKWFTQKV